MTDNSHAKDLNGFLPLLSLLLMMLFMMMILFMSVDDYHFNVVVE